MTKTRKTTYKKQNYKNSFKNRSYKTKSYKTKKRSELFKKRETYKRKGGSKEACCMCRKKINGTSFIPSSCLMKHGKIRSHKICSDCWWNTFAKEGISHQCPGCEKGLPLHGPSPPKLIDLTEDD